MALIASFYSFIGDQKKASDYLKSALPYSEPLSRNRIDMVNAIAVYNLRDSAKDEAFRYFEQALDIAEQAKDSVWIGIVSGNLSDREWEKGNYNKAIALVKKNIEYSNKFNEPLDAMRANLILASMYVKLKDWDSARKHVHEAQKGMSDKPYFFTLQN
ncbi:tetratricopeptide repeat protein [Sphingobacterium daejeonense]|uniref:tetratricopeptide repeat protein n=1 Tax=Sphingobacterium daejeonense TaxID=371142 RepID=UPI0010FF0AB9|nr:tetratricopeptide repeat protein [Sphingobacterium daejeonense]